MVNPKSKFDVKDHGYWAEVKTTIRFIGYVSLTFFAWFVYGSFVRRAYNKAVRENRIYYVDRMPGGKKEE